jgi:hypothetical protein
MTRFFFIGMVLVAAGCSTSSAAAPQHGYTGTWRGQVQGEDVTIITTTTQDDDSLISGTGNYVTPGGVQSFTVKGTSTRPSLSYGLHFGDTLTLVFIGEYVTADSAAGILQIDPSVGAPMLSMKRQ